MDKSRTVTFVVMGVLLIGLFHLWQAFAIYARSSILSEYGMSNNLSQLRLVFGFGWGIFWLWMGWTTYRQKHVSWYLLSTSFLGYVTFWWLLAQLSPSQIDQQRRLFWLIGGIVVISSVTIFNRVLGSRDNFFNN